MPRSAIPMLGALALLLAACDSSPEAPLEQIIVRQPGGTDGMATPSAADPPTKPVAAGRAAFSACSSCHAVAPGAASGVGPNLHGITGRKAGTLPGFEYSPPMAASGILWTEAELDAFLANPAVKVPGTTMVGGAVADVDRRRAIVAYLASLND